jgi:uncharacterized protein YndB with AHSA1/START domain
MSKPDAQLRHRRGSQSKETTMNVQRLTSEEAVRSGTGRGWDDWIAALDGWGAAERKHSEIATWLSDEHGLGGWWAQTITVTYERERGLREPGSSRDGLFEVSVSRTVAAPVERLFAAFADPGERERWLPGATVRERTSQPNRSARFDWEDGSTRLVVGFTDKGAGRSHVALVHEKLPDAKAAERAKSYWRERLDALKELLEADLS